MPKDCKAHIQMEERYSRLELDYNNIDEKKTICNIVNDLIPKHKVSPQITVCPKDIKSGEYIIEFHDDYDKRAGAFFEDLLKKLGIERCD